MTASRPSSALSAPEDRPDPRPRPWTQRAAPRAAALAAALLATLAASPDPGPPPPSDEVRALRAEVGELRQLVERLELKLTDQQQQLRRGGGVSAAPPASGAGGAKTPAQLELERQLEQELANPAATPAAAPMAQGIAPAPGPRSTDRNYLNLSLDGLFAGGTSTAQDVSTIQGGGHDPAQRGFTVQNVEMVLEGAVDPYFRGQGNLVFQLDPQGETNVELEEAFITTTSLPHNMQAKLGQFLAEFGRLNTQHPHSWDFVDQPLVNSRFLGGDGLRGPGARLSWLAPTPFYSELFLSAQNSNGETASSFRNTPGETQFGRPVTDRPVRTTGDMVFIPRYAASFDLSETQTVVLGLSSAFGPNGTGPSASTRIMGTDFYWKWKPANAEAGFPFVKFQSEFMQRRFEASAADVDGNGSIDLPAATLRDWGTYSQLVWGFSRGWTFGLRGDYLRGNGSRADPELTRESRWRLSPDVTWYPTEFSKLRFQYNHDNASGQGRDDSLWLQLEFTLGAHSAHKF